MTTHTKERANEIKASLTPLLKSGETVEIRLFGFATTDAQAALLPREVAIKIAMNHRGRQTNAVCALVTAEDAATVASLKAKLNAIRTKAKEQAARTANAHQYGI